MDRTGYMPSPVAELVSAWWPVACALALMQAARDCSCCFVPGWYVPACSMASWRAEHPACNAWLLEHLQGSAVHFKSQPGYQAAREALFVQD